jgi:hypothetical protein
MAEGHRLLPEFYKIARENVGRTYELVLSMEHRGKLFRARAMQWEYPYFRPVCQGDHVWFEGRASIEGGTWDKLPELPPTQ